MPVFDRRNPSTPEHSPSSNSRSIHGLRKNALERKKIFDALIKEAIELTFTPTYRLDFLKAFCTAVRTWLLAADLSRRSNDSNENQGPSDSNFPPNTSSSQPLQDLSSSAATSLQPHTQSAKFPILWATAWEVPPPNNWEVVPSGKPFSSDNEERFFLFGLPSRPHAHGFRNKHSAITVSVRFLGKNFRIEFLLDTLSEHEENDTKASILLAFRHCARQLGEFAPGLVCYWALNAAGALDGKQDIDAFIEKHPFAFEFGFRKTRSRPSDDQIRKTAKSLKTELSAINQQLSFLQTSTSKPDNPSSVLPPPPLQDHRPFLEFRRAYLDFFCIYLKGSNPDIAIQSYFLVYNPWNLTYSYRGLLPSDLVPTASIESTSKLATALANVIEASFNTSASPDNTPASLENALDELEQAGALLTGSDKPQGEELARLLRTWPFILKEPALQRFIGLLKKLSHLALPEHKELRQQLLLIALIQSIQQPYDTGMIEEFHRSNDVIIISGPLEPLMDAQRLKSHPRHVSIEVLYQLEKHLLFIKPNNETPSRDTTWLVLPLQAHHQQRGLWLVQISQSQRERQGNTAQEGALRTLRTAAPLIAGAFSLRLDATVANQFQDRVFERLSYLNTRAPSDALEEQFVAVVGALPSLFNTVISAYLQIPLRKDPFELDLDAITSSTPKLRLFFADDTPRINQQDARQLIFKESTHELPPHETRRKVRELLNSLRSNENEPLLKLLQEQVSQSTDSSFGSRELFGPFTTRLDGKNLQVLVNLCALQCMQNSDDVWKYRFRPQSLAAWLQLDPAEQENRRLHIILVSLETPLTDGLAHGVAEERFRTIAEMLQVARRREVAAKAETAREALKATRHSLKNAFNDIETMFDRETIMANLRLERLGVDAALALLIRGSPGKPGEYEWGRTGIGGSSFVSTLENALELEDFKLKVHAAEIDDKTEVDCRFLGMLIEFARNVRKRKHKQTTANIVIRRAKTNRNLVDVEIRTRCFPSDITQLIGKLNLQADNQFSGVSLIRQLVSALRDPRAGGGVEWAASEQTSHHSQTITYTVGAPWCRVVAPTWIFGPSWISEEYTRAQTNELSLLIQATGLAVFMGKQ